MIRCKNLNMYGLELKGSEPITPRTNKFLHQYNIHAENIDGYISVTPCTPGGLSFRQEVGVEFEKFKQDKDAYLSGRNLS